MFCYATCQAIYFLIFFDFAFFAFCLCAKLFLCSSTKPDNMKIPILIGAEQGGANAGTGTTSEDATMGSATDVSQGTGGGAPGGGGDGSSTSLQPGGRSSNSNSGLMGLSDEDSVEPATSYGMVNSNPNSSQHSLSLGFKQEPLMDTDPRYAWGQRKPIKQPNQKTLKFSIVKLLS